MSSTKTLEYKAESKNGAKRFLFAAVSILLEAVFLFLIFTRFSVYSNFAYLGLKIVSLILVLCIYAQHKTSSMKMPWIILILITPVLGVFLYLLVGMSWQTKKMRQRYEHEDQRLFPLLPENAEAAKKLKAENPQAFGIASYLKNNARYPVYGDSDICYYDLAAKGLEEQLCELAKAEKFIFMEYHAIENAESWQRIQAVLEERVAAGVEVRVFYDDMGSIFFIDKDFMEMLKSKGIRCRVFNPFGPGLNMFLNNRDHRKITVIDGRVGFTGGYNLANEYFNVTHPYGDWKDTGVKITGPAVKSLTMTFLEMWNAVSARDENDKDLKKYLPDLPYVQKEKGAFLVPYADSPMDDLHVGEDVYISMANKAVRYCYFMTPYLIITDELSHALSLAAMRGVDVRIITPGIPDKGMVYGVTRSFYNTLVRNGVRIFEWTPGFCHAKMSIADDVMATCGTINLDYRSLYHHFENGCFMVNCQAVKDMKADFDHTFTECREMTEQYKTGRSRRLRLGQLFLRLFAELL